MIRILKLVTVLAGLTVASTSYSGSVVKVGGDNITLANLDGYEWAEALHDVEKNPQELAALSWQTMTKPINFAGGQSFIWYRFTLENSLPRKETFVLFSLNSYIFDHLDLVISRTDGRIEHLESGLTVPRDQRPLLSRTASFPITLDPGERIELFLGVQSFMSRNNQFELRTQDSWRQFEATSSLMFGGLLGVLIISSLTSLVYFAANRKPLYLAFASATFAMLLSVGNSRGIISYLIPNALPRGSTSFQIAIIGLINVTMAWFTLEFLKLREWAPKSAKTLKGLIAVGMAVVLVTLSQVNPTLATKLLSLTVTITLPFQIGLGIFAVFKKRGRDAFIYLAGSIPYIASGQIWTMQNTAKIPLTTFTSFSVLYGQGIQIVVFTIALMFEIRRMTQAEAHALEQKRYGEKLSNMIRVLSHDLANYVMIITGSVSVLRRQIPASEAVQKYLNKIDKAAQNQEDIISSVRELKALEDGKLALKPEPVQLSSILPDLLETYATQLQNKHIRLELPSDLSEEIFVLAEKRALFHSVLCNIISNAIKFSSENSRIVVGVETDDHDVRIKIRDFGQGIKADKLAQMSSAQGSTTTLGTNGERGTGFGLMIISSYVALFGGTLHFASKTKDEHPTDHGTEVTITLKAAESIALRKAS